MALALSLSACAADPIQQSPHVGGTWTAVSIPGIESIDPFDAPRVQFTVGGQLVGEAGCADLDIPFGIDGDSIVIGSINTHNTSPCSDTRRRIQTAFLHALSVVTTITGGPQTHRLTLSGPNGDLVFAQPGPTPPP